MFEFAVEGLVRELLARLDGVLDDLSRLELSAHAGDDILDLLRGLEERTRRLASVDHALIAEVETRGLARERGAGSSTALLVDLLRISPREAHARVGAAARLAPRRGLSGEPMPPEYPQTAFAQAAGTISAAHAQLITTCIAKLPALVRDEQFDDIEAFFVEQAHQFAPDLLAKIARRLADTIDADGVLRDAAYRERHRDLTVHQRPDGSSSGTFELTAQATEALLSVLDATAAPRPASDGAQDPRTAGQRRHDGLLDGLLLALRSDELPSCNGVTTTILLTMTAEQAVTGEGLACTGHGATIPARDAFEMATDARVFPVVFDTVRRVESYGTSHRIFTEGQRLAMIARDGGCSFPGCTGPPLQSEAHHITDHAMSKRTTIDDGTLLCGFHHREHQRLGWRCMMLDGVPHWIPPRWIDPQQIPRRNRAHDPQLVG